MNATPAPAVKSTDAAVKVAFPSSAVKSTDTAVKVTAPAKKASTKAPAKKAPAKKAAAPAKVEKPKVPTVADRDMTSYENALKEFRALKLDVSAGVARLAYDTRRAVPDHSASHAESLAKLQSIVSAYREFARLLNEVAPPAK